MSTATVPTPVSAALTDLLDRARPASSLAAEQPLSASTFPRWKGTARDLSTATLAALVALLAVLVALVAPGLASGLAGSPAEHAPGVAAASVEAHPALQSPDVETRVRASTVADQTRVGAETADLASTHPGSAQFYDQLASGWLVAPRGIVDEALSGGRHSGFLRNYAGRSPVEIERGIGSLQRQIDDHLSWIDDPYRKIPNWDKLDPRQQQALLTQKWPGDIQRQREQLEILRHLLERGG